MTSKEVTFKVQMTCEGCSSAVKRILLKIEGVENVDASIETQLVKVTCNEAVVSENLFQSLKKWSNISGKGVELVIL